MNEDIKVKCFQLPNDVISATLQKNFDKKGRENPGEQHLAILLREGTLIEASFLYLTQPVEEFGALAFATQTNIYNILPSSDNTHLVSLRPQCHKAF